MKVAVYSICKNEEQHVLRWLKSVEEADRIIVLDTGSEDNTRELLAQHPKVELHTANFIPFRFDIARNMAANQVPDDYDLALFCDFDEVLEPGWRNKLEQTPAPYDAITLRMIFSRTADGEPDVVYNRLMAHRPHRYVWMYPIHEVLVPVNEHQNLVINSDVTVEHLPDPNKPRGQYLELLQTAVEEFNHDPRMRQYLGREHMYREEWGSAIIHLEKHVQMGDSAVCTAESYRYLSRCHEAMGSIAQAERALLQALAASPDQREPHAELSAFYQRLNDVERCLAFALTCAAVPDNPNYVIRERRYYREWPHHMAAWAYSTLGVTDMAVRHITWALNIAPEHPQVIADFISLTGKMPATLLQRINSGELSVMTNEDEKEDVFPVSGNQQETVLGAESKQAEEVPENVSNVESPISSGAS